MVTPNIDNESIADIDNESISVIYFEKLGVQFHLAFLSYHIFS